MHLSNEERIICEETYDGLIIDPCIPSEWDGFEVTRKWRGATYNIKVMNPDGVEKGVKSIMVNDRSVGGIIPIMEHGSINEVNVIMG